MKKRSVTLVQLFLVYCFMLLALCDKNIDKYKHDDFKREACELLDTVEETFQDLMPRQRVFQQSSPGQRALLWHTVDHKPGLLFTPIKQPLLLNISTTEVFRITTSRLFEFKAVQMWDLAPDYRYQVHMKKYPCYDYNNLGHERTLTFEASTRRQQMLTTHGLNKSPCIEIRRIPQDPNANASSPWIPPKIRFVPNLECKSKHLSLYNLDKWTNSAAKLGYCKNVDHFDKYQNDCSKRTNQLYTVGQRLGGCQCDNLCTIHQDCCDNFVPSSQSTSYRADIIKHLSCNSTEYSPESVQFGMGFYMVSDCPEESNTDLKRNCTLDIDVDQLTLRHYLPLETKDAIVFRNVYCARCFGVELSEAVIWQFHFSRPLRKRPCADVRNSTRTSINVVKALCGKKGYAFKSKHIVSGNSRMGKLCVTKTFKVNQNHAISSSKKISNNDSCEHARAEAIASTSNLSPKGLKLVMKTKNGFRVISVSSAKAVCQSCDPMIAAMISFNPLAILPYFGYTRVNQLSIIFRNCELTDDCDNEVFGGGHFSKQAHDIVSLSGCLVSFCLLCVLLAIMNRKRKLCASKSRRFQTCLLVTKMVFMICFCLNHFSRDTACLITGALLHASLWLTFTYSGLCSLGVCVMMWKLKNNIAAMAIENKNAGEKMSRGETCCHVGAVVTNVGIIVIIIVYHSVVDDELFGLGRNGQCVTATKNGILYLLVVPMFVLFILNVLFTGYGGFTYYSLMKSNPLRRDSTARLLLLFLGRMIAYQGIQWVLGLLYYVLDNDTIGFLFEIAAAFEGCIIFASLAPREIDRK